MMNTQRIKSSRQRLPRSARYTLGLGSLAVALISGSQLALGLLATLYCVRRVRAFRGLM